MHSKDLLRFEKDYVTGVFNEERDGNIKNFYLNKLLTQTPKPMMSQQSSDCKCCFKIYFSDGESERIPTRNG